MWGVSMLGTAIEVLLTGGMLVLPFMGIFYAWAEWPGAMREVRIPLWHHVAILVGLISVTFQVIAFVALWVPFSQHDAFLRLAVPIELLLVAPTALSIFIWKHKARWWLLASSICLCVDSFMCVVAQLD